MKGIQFDNAAQRKTYVGYVYEAGTRAIQKRVLEELPPRWSDLHRQGRIHIHDLEAYGQTYNCLQVNLLQGFPFSRFEGYSDSRKIIEIFNHYKDLIVKLGNEQSGGIGFPNFDEEIAILFGRMGIPPRVENMALLRDSIGSFIDWVNRARERCGQVTYYVTLNLGLSTAEVGRFATRATIEYFESSSLEVIKPNIVFKVKKGVNHAPEDPNHDLFRLALESTCKKMIPTYLLCDATPNAKYDSRRIGIMGCRTRVVENVFGEATSVGRGNIDYVTINLPRIAFEVLRDFGHLSVGERVERFNRAWAETAEEVRGILLDRYTRLLGLDADDFPVNKEYHLQLVRFDTAGSMEAVFRNGTLSVGFIGLSDAFQLITGEKYWASEENHALAQGIVRHMREVVDGFRTQYGLNFTLLASSGEYISGRFPALDREHFAHPILDRGFYTNSFHVDVDSGLNPLEKIRYEGPFHMLANGGCISYVEFSSAPLGNVEAVAEVIDAGVRHGVTYLGFNFPLDNCRSCNALGTFDRCPHCGSVDIYRVRRVSGYLEELAFFTKGKQAEVSSRRPNAREGRLGTDHAHRD